MHNRTHSIAACAHSRTELCARNSAQLCRASMRESLASARKKQLTGSSSQEAAHRKQLAGSSSQEAARRKQLTGSSSWEALPPEQWHFSQSGTLSLPNKCAPFCRTTPSPLLECGSKQRAWVTAWTFMPISRSDSIHKNITFRKNAKEGKSKDSPNPFSALPSVLMDKIVEEFDDKQLRALASTNRAWNRPMLQCLGSAVGGQRTFDTS